MRKQLVILLLLGAAHMSVTGVAQRVHAGRGAVGSTDPTEPIESSRGVDPIIVPRRSRVEMTIPNRNRLPVNQQQQSAVIGNGSAINSYQSNTPVDIGAIGIAGSGNTVQINIGSQQPLPNGGGNVPAPGASGLTMAEIRARDQLASSMFMNETGNTATMDAIRAGDKNTMASQLGTMTAGQRNSLMQQLQQQAAQGKISAEGKNLLSYLDQIKKGEAGNAWKQVQDHIAAYNKQLDILFSKTASKAEKDAAKAAIGGMDFEKGDLRSQYFRALMADGGDKKQAAKDLAALYGTVGPNGELTLDPANLPPELRAHYDGLKDQLKENGIKPPEAKVANANAAEGANKPAQPASTPK